LQNRSDAMNEFQIDMYEKLPTPWGLVRSGVAPDHPKIKSVSKVFEKIADDKNFKLLANVEIGKDISLPELEACYDAVILAAGTPKGKKLGIPGENLKNVFTAAEFVSWYNGHPDFKDLQVDLSGKSAIVIGAGNVAMDIGRILAVNVKDLEYTDTANHALESLRHSNLNEVLICARRSAEHASFTAPELRELPAIEDLNVIIDPYDIELAKVRAGEQPERHVRSNLESMESISKQDPKPYSKTLSFKFEHVPTSVEGSEKVEFVTFQTPSGEVRVACNLLITAIGYEPEICDGLEIEGSKYKNYDGHIRGNLFVVGWAKRGPSGVIGTNKSDSSEVVDLLIQQLRLSPPKGNSQDLCQVKTIPFVDLAGWRRIDMKEIANGAELGKPRVKFVERDDLLSIANS
jgi:ferredoxin--NADP+ reductase